MIVVFLHGSAASGKHTIGTALSRLLNIPLFHNHLTVDLARVLFDFGTPGFIGLRERVWLAAFGAAAAAGVSFVFTFHPEATVDPALIGRLSRLIERSGGRIHFVEIRCAEEVIEERLSLDSRAAFGKLRDLQLYRSLREAGAFHFPPMPTPLIVVDSGELSPDAAALRIQDALGVEV